MFLKSTIVLFLVKIGVVLERELDGAAHYGVGINLAVGLGYKASVDGAWLVVARGTMVFGRIGNGVDFILIEPLLQPLIFTNDVGAVDVM